ncbi:restriction endonuclease subunit S [Corynebacterium xerosis]|uniref:restriction endonuclease subunit S n=1 Tax=Corynebacterium xerosis TaxID=1725 RepID=UPI003879586C
MSTFAPLWTFCTINDDLLSESTNTAFRFDYVDISNVTPGRISQNLEETTFSEAPSRARRLARPGDVIVSTVRTYLRAVAPVYESPRPRVYSTGFAVIRPDDSKSDSRFVRYCFTSDEIIDEIIAHSTGVSYPAINAADIARLRLPLPDLPTQRRIADYLDRETAQIDAMAESLDGLVARLEERYARVVEEGTRLDIPHLPLGYCASIYNGSTPSRSRTDFWRDTPGVAWLNSSAVNQVPVTCPSRYVTNTAISECHLPEVRRGDLLMGITGQGRTRGMVSISSIPGTISQHVASIRLNERAHPRFMFWVLKSRYGTIRMNSEGSGSTKGAVTLDEIKRISVPLPPLDEQRRIADHLDEETAKIDAMIAKVGDLRALLEERRSALITATVTGQHPVPEEP